MTTSYLDKLDKVSKSTPTPTTTPAPCPTRSCPLFWRPFSAGPLYCAVCHPPTNAKQFAMVVGDGNGGLKFIHHQRGNFDAGKQPVPDAGTPAGGEVAATDGVEFDAWYAQNLPRSQTIMQLMDLKKKYGKL